MTVSLFTLSFLLFISDLSAVQQSFGDGRQVAVSRKGDTGSGIDKGSVPQYQDGHFIHSDKLKESFEELESNEHGRVLRDIHQTRKPYILDDTEPFMVRSEKAHQNPKEAFEETEEIEADSDSYTIETCEECPDVEYFVKARMIKKRYVYLQTPPYITAGKTCENHGHLTIKVEIVSEPEEIFREDGAFNNITHISTVPWGGAYVDETYQVNGVNIVLRKTIQQNGAPWIHPECYLVPSLQNHVVSAATMITKLLGGANDEYIHWGDIGNAYLHHRVVNDTGEHYWIPDDAYKHYEELCDQGLCRYESYEDDPPSDKYWKGKKVNGSWGRTMTFACRSACKDTCGELKARGCSREPDPECIETKDSKCLKYRWKFKCRDKIGAAKHKFSKQNPFCLGGDCIDSGYESDRDMVQALAYLSIIDEAAKDREIDGESIRIFKGSAHHCNRIKLGVGIKDCCGTYKGLGVSLGLTKCDEDAKMLAKLRGEGKCVYVGNHCAERTPILKICIRYKYVYCCFGSKFAKLLQEQGRPQLGKNFGTSECPDCSGLSPDDLSKIDFSQFDLSEISSDVMDRFKPQSGEHFAQEGELERIRRQMQEKQVLADAEAPDSEAQKAVSDIAAMPMQQRREAIANVLQKASSKNLLPEERTKLQAYLDATVPIAAPTYSPTYVLKHTAWGHHDGYTNVTGRFFGLRWTDTVPTPAYSFDDQYAVDHVTKAETYVQRHKYYNNPSYHAVHTQINATNQAANAKNAELEAEYKRKSEAQKAAHVPVEALTRVISASEIADMPVDQLGGDARRILHKAKARKSSGEIATQYLKENMRHLTGSLKLSGGKK